MIIKYLIEKEFKQIIRNSFIPRMILIFPVMMMLVLPWAANFEIKNINLSVIDNDHSVISKRLVQKVSSSGYFRLVDVSPTFGDAMDHIESGEADIILEIPEGLEKDMTRGELGRVLISANTVNGTKGGLGSSYMSGIVADFASEIRSENGSSVSKTSISPSLEIVSQNRYNPHLNYKFYMVPALMVMLMTLLCGFLPAFNIVGEKEKGTIEQINVTPVNKFVFIVSKLIPYWIIGFVVLTLCFVLAAWVYNMVPVGHLLTMYVFTIFYVLAISGFGLIISNYSDTMQQAMFVMYFFIMILILLSGLFTPISAMPQWAQNITIFNPLKYFMQVMRLVYLKGSNLADVTTQMIALVGFALFFNTWAILSYRKKS